MTEPRRTAYQVLACLSALLLLCGPTLRGQGILTPVVPDAYLAAAANPALYSRVEDRFTVGLPLVTEQIDLGGLNYSSLLPLIDGRRLLDLNRLARAVGPTTTLTNEYALTTLGVGYRTGAWGFSIGHRLRSRAQINFPSELVRVVAEGNAQFIGQSVEVAPSGELSNFHELHLGASYRLSENVSVGARFKYLLGINDVRIEPGGSLLLRTDEDNFALALEQDLRINSAGALDYNSLRDFNLGILPGSFSGAGPNGGNRGIALDVGIHLDYDDIRLQAAVSDLGGGIDWGSDVTNLQLTGTANFDGLDVLGEVLDAGFSLDASLDSLEATFEPTQSDISYGSRIGATYMAAGELDFAGRWTGLAVVRYRERLVGGDWAAAIGARYALRKHLHFALHYNLRGEDAVNLGGQLYGAWGPLRFLIGSDDLTAVVRPSEAGELGVYLGFTLGFGEAAAQ